MQRPTSWTGLTSLAQQHRYSQQPLPQGPYQQPQRYSSSDPPARPVSFHDDRRSTMHQTILSAIHAPLGALHDQQRTELPRPYKCPLCDKAFHRLEHQTRHIRTHTGEKPHACCYAGCSKRFSRSDELTRHSRIHTNPNSRRSTKSQQVAALASASHNTPAGNSTSCAVPEAFASACMMPPPPKMISKSAPPSHGGSPNVSPPNSYHGMHVPPIHSSLSPFARAVSSSALVGGVPGALDLSLLAHTASQQLDRENGQLRHLYSTGTASRLHLSPLAQPMSRSHSHEDDDPYTSHRSVKKSRPSSPVSTAPSSPTFSHDDSCSPTPESTPLCTPAHSPRLYPRDLDYTMQLPSIRHLSLGRMPTLAPMEVADPYLTSTLTVSAHPTSGMRVGDILNRPDGAQRKLPSPPVPRVAVHDLLNTGDKMYGYHSTASSPSGGDLGDLGDRHEEMN